MWCLWGSRTPSFQGGLVGWLPMAFSASSVLENSMKPQPRNSSLPNSDEIADDKRERREARRRRIGQVLSWGSNI